MIKPTGEANIFILMEQYLKENGEMINKKDEVLKYGQMAHVMKEIFIKEKKPDKEDSFGLMVQVI